MPDSSRGTAVAVALAVVGLLVAAQGFEHEEPPKYRVFGGPTAIWDIPDGSALKPSLPVRLRIPSARIDAAISPIGENPEGGIAVPPVGRSQEAAWYDGSPMPGSRGSAILVGHYDDDKGGAVFYRANRIRKNDEIKVVRADGTAAVFRVDALEQVNKALFPTHRVYGRVGYAGLRLITCGGKYDKARRHFADNVIIYAHLARQEDVPRPRRGAR